MDATAGAAARAKHLAVYLAMLASAVAVFVLVRHLGQSLIALPRPAGQVAFGAASGATAAQSLLSFLAALIVVIASARVLGAVFARLGQAPVIGEMIAGIVLGPSLLGRAWPAASFALFPTSVVDLLGLGAQASVVLFMFLVGLDLNPRHLKGHSHVTVVTSHAGIVAPFVLGTLLALYLYPRYATPDVPFAVFALFSGVSLSVTAFPVLVRILGDLGIQHTRLGVLALACAAVDDVSAWLLLAALTGVAQADATSALRALGLTVAYVIVMFALVRPRLERLVGALDASGGLNRTAMSLGFLGILASALVTEWIGIHALFGAFLLGVVTPHDSAVAEDLRRRLEDLVVVLALPVFFAYTGLRTRIGLAGGYAEWLDLVLIVAVATAGKVGGSFVAAWGMGVPRRDALALGILMNTRGLMELIVLNVGLDLGVLSPELFALLVVMAIATTVVTTPLVRPLVRSQERGETAASS